MSNPDFEVRLAVDAADLQGAQRLRYRVFVEELGGGGVLVDHQQQFEIDRFDPVFDHMVLVDTSRDPNTLNHVIGVYRLLRQSQADKIGQFYSEDEYDLGVLRKSGRNLLELGRSCLHNEYRNGAAMVHLWNGLADYVADHNIDIMFGVASFHGVDIAQLAEPLSLLHHRHMAPTDLRVHARASQFQNMNIIKEANLDRRRAMVQIPALIKAYLRLGGVVGEGAFIDHAFNTTDVCLIMDTQRMNQKQHNLYRRQSRGVGA